MKAIVYRQYGPPDVLHVEEIEKPSPADDELLIKVHAAEVTKADCEMRDFNFQVKWFWLPLRIALGLTKPRKQVLGGYFAGEIESIGKDVVRFKVGDFIFGTTGFRFGAYAEYICLPDSYTLAPKPNNMSFAEAAAVPLGGMNALHFLRKANVKPGESVLVNGAGGSIGAYAVQIAKSMGAEVTAVDSANKEEMLQRIGADYFIDYRKEDFTKNKKSYDVILSVVANNNYSACIGSLKTEGRYLMANPYLSNMLSSVLTSQFSDKKAIFAFAGEKQEELGVLKEMIEAGKIISTVDRVYSYEQVAEAHRRVETEQRLGSVVIAPNDMLSKNL